MPEKTQIQKQKTKTTVYKHFVVPTPNLQITGLRSYYIKNQLDRIHGIRVSLLFVELISYPVMALFPQSRRVPKTLTVSRRLAARAGWFNSTERETFSNNKEWSS
jgi:hypothetical protein